MSERADPPPITAEQAARVAPGPGIVVHRKPLTVVVADNGDAERTARGITEAIDALVDDGDLSFGAVAAGLQQFVVDHQPSGVAAVLDVTPDAIGFLFDKAAAIGTITTHRASGRSGWTTVFLEGRSISLIAGPGPERPVDAWTSVWAGTVSGQGAQVDLSRSYDPTAVASTVPEQPPIQEAKEVLPAPAQQEADEFEFLGSTNGFSHNGHQALDPATVAPSGVEDGLTTGESSPKPLVEMPSPTGTSPVDEHSKAFEVLADSDIETPQSDTATPLDRTPLEATPRDEEATPLDETALDQTPVDELPADGPDDETAEADPFAEPEAVHEVLDDLPAPEPVAATSTTIIEHDPTPDEPSSSAMPSWAWDSPDPQSDPSTVDEGSPTTQPDQQPTETEPADEDEADLVTASDELSSPSNSDADLFALFADQSNGDEPPLADPKPIVEASPTPAQPIAGPPPMPVGLSARPPQAEPIAGPPPMPSDIRPPVPQATPISGPPPMPSDLPPPPGAVPIAGQPPMPDGGERSSEHDEPG